MSDPGETAPSSFLYLGRDRSPARAPAKNDTKLLRAIECEIVPRLMLAHQPAKAASRGGARLTDDDRALFLDLVRAGGESEIDRFLDALTLRGVPDEDVLLDLMAGAARRLGALWEEDASDFTEVTIGLCRLHAAVRGRSRAFDPDGRASAAAPRILLATLCGDQHIFGLSVVAEFFRRDGWRVRCEPGAGRGDVASHLRLGGYDVVGLSAACDAPAARMRAEIAALRAASANPSLQVIVGGRVFAETPELASAIGADAAICNAADAPREARLRLALAPAGC